MANCILLKMHIDRRCRQVPLICLEWAYDVEGRREFGGLDGTFALVAHILTIPWFEDFV